MRKNFEVKKWLYPIALLTVFAFLLSASACDSNESGTETTVEDGAETTAAVEYNTTQFNNPISFSDAPDPFITYDPETLRATALRSFAISTPQSCL